ncbi:MAG: ribonuclease HI family protein [bacterium]|nr:ribonuclease HI family protein [bacterium]
MIWIDGAARGNPGPASAAGVIKQGADIVAEWGVPLGNRTNNEAEYSGLLLALYWLQQFLPNAEGVIHSDSQLLVEQTIGRWKVKADNLQPFHREAQWLIHQIPGIKLTAVRREKNKAADALANRALDEHRVVVSDDYLPFVKTVLVKLPFTASQYTIF